MLSACSIASTGLWLDPTVRELFHTLRIEGNKATRHFRTQHREAIRGLKVARSLAVWFHRAFADQVEQQVNNAQTRVNKLTQSILAKAFRGELTAEWRAANPELIGGENSAEALLERIKAEKAKHKPTQKRRRGSASTVTVENNDTTG